MFSFARNWQIYDMSDEVTEFCGCVTDWKNEELFSLHHGVQTDSGAKVKGCPKNCTWISALQLFFMLPVI